MYIRNESSSETYLGTIMDLYIAISRNFNNKVAAGCGSVCVEASVYLAYATSVLSRKCY
jgi:hypothetical protein